MRRHTTVLLLWIAAASVRCQNEEITVKSQSKGILLKCGGKQVLTINGNPSELALDYKDESSGEYECVDPNSLEDPTNPGESSKIYVKFRTCDNCVEMDLTSLIGLIVGNVVATAAIGVAVYLTAAHSRTNLSSAPRKSSDRQHLFPNEVRNRPPNDHYQPLNHKGGQKDMYDVLSNRR